MNNLLDYLRTHGRFLIAGVIENTPALRKAIFDEARFVLLPSDDAIDTMMEVTRVNSLDAFNKKMLSSIWENHISTVRRRSKFETIQSLHRDNLWRAISGNTFPYNPNAVLRKGVKIGTVDDCEILHLSGFPQRDIYLIDCVLATERQRNLVTTANIVIEKGFETMSYDLFRDFVLRGELRGLDFIALCVTNSDVNAKCNASSQKIFRDLISLEKRRVRRLANRSRLSPRDFYFMWHVRELFNNKGLLKLWYTIDNRDNVKIKRVDYEGATRLGENVDITNTNAIEAELRVMERQKLESGESVFLYILPDAVYVEELPVVVQVGRVNTGRVNDIFDYEGNFVTTVIKIKVPDVWRLK